MKNRSMIVLAFLLAGCSNLQQLAQSAGVDEEQARQEQEKVLRNHESICFKGAAKSLDLFYSRYEREVSNEQLLYLLFGTRFGNRQGPPGAKNLEPPPQRLPLLEPDLLRSVVQKTGRFRDNPKLEQALLGPINDALNSRIPMLNDGTYNTVHVRIGQTGYLGITPGTWLPEELSEGLQLEDRAASVLVWVPESGGRDFLRAILENTALDSVWAFDRNGNLISARNQSLGVTIGDRPDLSSRFRDYVTFPPGRYPARCTSKIP